MPLLEQIDQEMKQAMIAKDRAKLDVLRFLKSAIKYVGLEKKDAPLTDVEIMQVIQKQVKQRRESIEQFKKGGRADLASKEEQELAYLEAYLPKQMPDEELRVFIEAQAKEVQAAGKKDFGRMMKLCTEKLAGRADSKRISEVLGKILS